MKINIQDYNNVTVIELQGDLDLDVSELFRNTIIDVIVKQKTCIVLDMSGVDFIDSQGLEQLLWSRDYCSENKRELRIAGLAENCRRILEITQLENEFDHYPELSAAVKSFA